VFGLLTKAGTYWRFCGVRIEADLRRGLSRWARITQRKLLLRARLEQSGKLIGANDLLIAAQVLALGHVLVTDNEREFDRVEGLRHENWLR
jgi:predicted nucleic acid-binding protein